LPATAESDTALAAGAAGLAVVRAELVFRRIGPEHVHLAQVFLARRIERVRRLAVAPERLGHHEQSNVLVRITHRLNEDRHSRLEEMIPRPRQDHKPMESSPPQVDQPRRRLALSLALVANEADISAKGQLSQLLGRELRSLRRAGCCSQGCQLRGIAPAVSRPCLVPDFLLLLRQQSQQQRAASAGQRRSMRHEEGERLDRLGRDLPRLRFAALVEDLDNEGQERGRIVEHLQGMSSSQPDARHQRRQARQQTRRCTAIVLQLQQQHQHEDLVANVLVGIVEEDGLLILAGLSERQRGDQSFRGRDNLACLGREEQVKDERIAGISEAKRRVVLHLWVGMLHRLAQGVECIRHLGARAPDQRSRCSLSMRRLLAEEQPRER
jgi:hypothetical protein